MLKPRILRSVISRFTHTYKMNMGVFNTFEFKTEQELDPRIIQFCSEIKNIDSLSDRPLVLMNRIDQILSNFVNMNEEEMTQNIKVFRELGKC